MSDWLTDEQLELRSTWQLGNWETVPPRVGNWRRKTGH